MFTGMSLPIRLSASWRSINRQVEAEVKVSEIHLFFNPNLNLNLNLQVFKWNIPSHNTSPGTTDIDLYPNMAELAAIIA